MAKLIVSAEIDAPILVCSEGLSFWGGVDATSGTIIDAHHPLHGQSISGKAVMMPTSRGSCTGSGVLLGLAFADAAPRALIFSEGEDILTLGAMVAARMFGHEIAVVRLSQRDYDLLARETSVTITGTHLQAGALALALQPVNSDALELSDEDHDMLSGAQGIPRQRAIEIVTNMAAAQGARRLIDVTRVHIDGCIYASDAFVTFARTMADLGARVCVPTTMNAISVDHANWRSQGVPEAFGLPASSLADAYVEMGAAPSFTCAPYLLKDVPMAGEDIAWAESNAVIYANSVLGARTVKHADFMDLCIALTGRAPQSGVYLEDNRAPCRVINVQKPAGADDAFWPMLGWLAGKVASDRIPLIRGLEETSPSNDDLKALCAAYGTTSASPMLHVAEITPEAGLPLAEGADQITIEPKHFAQVWAEFNKGAIKVDLVALGSPHFSQSECEAFATLMEGRQVHADVTAIITLGRATLGAIRDNGTALRLENAGVSLVPDLCWCSISEPVFPPAARVLMTNSGKYAHYAPGLCNREVRFGSLAECADAATTARTSASPPGWISALAKPT